MIHQAIHVVCIVWIRNKIQENKLYSVPYVVIPRGGRRIPDHAVAQQPVAPHLVKKKHKDKANENQIGESKKTRKRVIHINLDVNSDEKKDDNNNSNWWA